MFLLCSCCFGNIGMWAFVMNGHKTEGEMDCYRITQGLPYDALLGVVARRSGLSRAEVLGLYVLLLDTASRDGGGSVKALDPEAAGGTLEIDTAKVSAALKAMTEKGLVDDAGCISNWWLQQGMSSTERVRNWRKKRQEREARNNPDDPENIARRHARMDRRVKMPVMTREAGQ